MGSRFQVSGLTHEQTTLEPLGTNVLPLVRMKLIITLGMIIETD